MVGPDLTEISGQAENSINRGPEVIPGVVFLGADPLKEKEEQG
jgi:hypothetical protein